jgi:predicted GTPase
LDQLHTYKQNKLALAERLRIVRDGLIALARPDSERQCSELMVKLAEDRFSLAVLGQFKRGKSSLMNAIIGRELLPTGVLPLTSAITVLKYGPAERLIIKREGSIFTDELPVSALPDYVTEKGNPGNKKKIKTACIELPVPFLRNGIEFVDTPGVGSAIIANTETTYGFLPECDAVLFVTSVDTPLTSVELDFLRKIGQYVNKIFFIVNKIDLVTEGEKGQVLEFVSETIKSQIKSDTVNIFAVSARLAIEGSISGNTALYEQSGLKALEEALAAFLSKEKSTIFLASVAHKVLQVLDNELSQGITGETALQARAKTIQEQKVKTVHQDLHTVALSLVKARAKLEALSNDILVGKLAKAEVVEATPLIAQIPRTQSIPKVTDLLADIHTRGCPVCEHIGEQALDFFVHWQYRISAEENARKEFATELGFCPVHTWQLLSLCSPHGASIGLAQLAEHIALELKEASNTFLKGEKVGSLVHDSSNCRICKLLRQEEKDYIHQLASLVEEPTGRSHYQRSQGVCLRHLSLLLDVTVSSESHDFLLSHAVKCFEEDAEDMRSYSLKIDALRRGLQNSNEEDAYRRTVIRMVGDRNVCLPWAEDRLA